MAVFIALAMPNAMRARASEPVRIRTDLPPHLIRVSDDSFCLDEMETEPDDDEMNVTAIAMVIDDGCVVPDGTIAT
ncbi:MAG TPA: hypothetical protein VGM26_15815 [Rhizomicrobium sp.]